MSWFELYAFFGTPILALAIGYGVYLYTRRQDDPAHRPHR